MAVKDRISIEAKVLFDDEVILCRYYDVEEVRKNYKVSSENYREEMMAVSEAVHYYLLVEQLNHVEGKNECNILTKVIKGEVPKNE